MSQFEEVLPSQVEGQANFDMIEESRATQERRERAHRILDAASMLILRWGYNKTTIDDIAKQAGVGKGTIYLHWKTREELFRMLLKREQLEMSEELQQMIAADPAGAMLGNMLKHSALALIHRPLIKAYLLRDMEILGKLVQREQNNPVYISKLEGLKGYLDFLRAYGLVRNDLSVQEQLYTLSAIMMGFFLIAPLMPGEYALSDERLAELVGDAVHRALEPEHTVPLEQMEEASRNFLGYMQQVTALLRQEFQQNLDA